MSCILLAEFIPNLQILLSRKEVTPQLAGVVIHGQRQLIKARLQHFPQVCFCPAPSIFYHLSPQFPTCSLDLVTGSCAAVLADGVHYYYLLHPLQQINKTLL